MRRRGIGGVVIELFGQGHVLWSHRVAAVMFDIAEAAGEAARFLAYRAALYRSRRDLGELTDEQLRDVGLTRQQAQREASRPFFED